MRKSDKLGGKWIPKNKYGVKDEAAFLVKHEAQEKALADYIDIVERSLLRRNLKTGVRAADYIDQQVSVGKESFKITMEGSFAAAYYGGPTGFPRFLQYLLANNWHPDLRSVEQGGKLTHKEVEDYNEMLWRLREFGNVKYRKN